ncbi:MAG: hypothetical protein ISR58_05330 [Anaerolineales bacterium]|nr:hypothetical protein [Chloroflexota bacterium]MBL6980596.1 hypothetical protein [Anaerolineales bacterium]
MQELETIQPEESRDVAETVESTEAVEEQALDDATLEPGARVEEEQSFEQAEAVEGALTDAMASVEPVEDPPEEESPPESDTDPEDLPPGSGVLVVPHETVQMAEPLEEPGPADGAEVPEGIEFQLAEEEDDSDEPDEFYVDDTGIILFNEAISTDEVVESLSEEQKNALDGLDPGDREALLRVIGNSQQVLPDQFPGKSGGFIY